MVDMLETWVANKPYCDIIKRKTKVSEMLPISQTLFNRIKTEQAHYWTEVTTNEKRSIACNPLLATTGLRNMELLEPDLLGGTRDSCIKGMVDDIVDRGLKMPARRPDTGPIIELLGQDSMSDEEVDSDDDLADTLQKRMSQESARSVDDFSEIDETTTNSVLLRTRAETQVKAFFNAHYDWLHEITDMGGNLAKKDGRLVTKKNDVAYKVLPFFDVLDWWNKSVAATKYDLIRPLALAYLAIPDSNAFQERVFNRSQMMRQDKRRSQTSKMLFEMKTLGCTNKALIQKAPEYIEQELGPQAIHQTKADDTEALTKMVRMFQPSSADEEEVSVQAFLGGDEDGGND